MPLNATQPVRPARSLAARAAWVLFAALLFVVLTSLLDGGPGVAPSQWLQQPRFALANALPGLLLAGVLLVVTRRLLLSFGLAFLVQGVFYAVNTLKVANLGTPLLPDDFRMVGQLRRGGAHLLFGYLPHSPWPYLGMLVAVALVAAIWRFEPPLFARRTGGKRLLAGGVLAALLVSLLIGTSTWGRIYNGHVLWMEPWSAASTSVHSGMISSLVMFQLQNGHNKQKPDHVAASQLIDQSAAAMKQYMQTPAAGHDMPDIVVIQSESFFDPTIMRGYEHSQFTPNLKRLAEHGMSGPLHVPTFGGGTIRTEFEVLTGLSLRYFDNLQFPYLQMNKKSVPSLVRTLNGHGYDTIALHGNDPTFWNRSTAFKALGFNRFVSQSSFPANAANDGKYMADSAMTDEIMAQMKDSGPPQFIFAISIEAHGPYDVEPAHADERDAIPVPNGLADIDKRELQNYIYHMRHADAELGRLVAWLAKRNRPSLLLFYGDHLPGLTDSYRTTGFVDGQNMLSQAGTWLMVDPHNLHGKSVSTDTAAWLLPGKLLEQAGIHDDPYFALTTLVGPQLASLTKAPGAPPPAEAGDEQRIDQAMSSVDQLRMSGKLDTLLPKIDTPQASGIVRDDAARPSPPSAPAALFY
jgi:phosphoglycerol transferase MdoB-like AlkP superfamily enzyme